MLLTGSIDGSVKLWRLDLPSSRSGEKQALKNFSLSDMSRLIVEIGERSGCHRTESIEYINEDGETQKDYKSVEVAPSGCVGFGRQKQSEHVKSQCDAVKWSKRGRFAIASITSQLMTERCNGGGQDDDEMKDEVCRIKIWDTENETFYDDLARPSGLALKKNSWVLAPHPIVEELLMTGSDGGTLLMWNIETK